MWQTVSKKIADVILGTLYEDADACRQFHFKRAEGFPMCGEYDLKTCIAMLIMDRLDIGGSFAEFHPLSAELSFSPCPLTKTKIVSIIRPENKKISQWPIS